MVEKKTVLESFFLATPTEVGRQTVAALSFQVDKASKDRVAKKVEFGCSTKCEVHLRMKGPDRMRGGCPNFQSLSEVPATSPKPSDPWKRAITFAGCTSQDPKVPIFDVSRNEITGHEDPTNTSLHAILYEQEKSGKVVLFVEFGRDIIKSEVS